MAEAGVLMDTHVWIWTVEGAAEQLGETAVAEIDDASREGRLYVSVISVWEVAMLESRGRITLSTPVGDWVAAAVRAPGVSLLPLDPSVAIESTRLPDAPHGDPADRILMATARISSIRLGTCDDAIVRYGSAGHVRILDCRR